MAARQSTAALHTLACTAQNGNDGNDGNDARTALILGGGGARAAYQVGVLDAIRQVTATAANGTAAIEDQSCPFDILCGTSAGAINVAFLASQVERFNRAVEHLVSVWGNFTPGDIYRTDLSGSLANATHWLGALSMGWLVREAPRSLFDNRPLRELLQAEIDFHAIDEAIVQGRLAALAINASSYSSGHHVTFYQSRRHIRPWSRTQRQAVATPIGIDHLIASSAIPFVFPATRLTLDGHPEYFGDGAMRQSAPVSPAIHLGATRIVVIGAGQVREQADTASPAEVQGASQADAQTDYPSLGQIGGHVMASIFLDGMAADVERLERINRTLEIMTPAQQAACKLRPLELLSITPSERLDTLAEPFVRKLPRTTRSALRVLGATGRRGVGLASYLLFDRHYTEALIELGRQDGLARATDIEAFFSGSSEAASAAASATR